jgi:hypothetical protein
MKIINVTNKNGILISQGNKVEEVDNFLNINISNNSWGKPERWILKDSESYDPSDVLENEDRIDQLTGETSSWVKLKAEYTIEIEDLGSSDTYFKNNLDDYLFYLNNQMNQNFSDPQKYEELKIKLEKILLKKKALSLLSSTDWTQTLDNLKIRGEEWVDKWGTYRVELRKVVNDQRDTLPEEIK